MSGPSKGWQWDRVRCAGSELLLQVIFVDWRPLDPLPSWSLLTGKKSIEDGGGQKNQIERNQHQQERLNPADWFADR
jgi:hypothetical protein